MKKLLTSLFIVVLMLQLLLVLPVSAAGVSVSASSATALAGDENVAITITLSGNTGITGMILTVDYDDALTLVKVDRGDALGTLELAQLAVPYLDPVVLSWDGMVDDTTNGVLVTLVFNVDENAASGKYDIKVSYKNGDIYDENLNDITASVGSGYIEVHNCSYANAEKVAAKDATCVDKGNEAYGKCSCGQLFDTAGNKIDAIPETAIDPANHVNKQTHAEVVGDCTTPGHAEYVTCKDCGVIVSGSDADVYGDHSYGDIIEAVPSVHTSTELKAGVDAHYICGICGKYFTSEKAETTLEALTGAVPAHDYGNTLKYDDNNHWSECGCGHKAAVASHNWKWKTDKAATKTETGLKHEECSCGAKRSENTEIPVIKDDHVHKYVEWKSSGVNHWLRCSCGQIKNVEHHKYEWIIDKKATDKEDGLKHEECECGVVRNVNTVIPMIVKPADTTVPAETTAPADTTVPADTTTVAPVETTVPSETTGNTADTKNPEGNGSAQTSDMNIAAIVAVGGLSVLGFGAVVATKKKNSK